MDWRSRPVKKRGFKGTLLPQQRNPIFFGGVVSHRGRATRLHVPCVQPAPWRLYFVVCLGRVGFVMRGVTMLWEKAWHRDNGFFDHIQSVFDSIVRSLRWWHDGTVNSNAAPLLCKTCVATRVALQGGAGPRFQRESTVACGSDAMHCLELPTQCVGHVSFIPGLSLVHFDCVVCRNGCHIVASRSRSRDNQRQFWYALCWDVPST